jgi:hypothetical protein
MDQTIEAALLNRAEFATRQLCRASLCEEYMRDSNEKKHVVNAAGELPRRSSSTHYIFITHRLVNRPKARGRENKKKERSKPFRSLLNT